jgi:hypothetical protein
MTREFYGATADAQRSINDLLLLPATGKEQDWEFELAKPNRIAEMMQVATAHALNFEERCALFLLLIASMEQMSETGNLENHLILKAHLLLGDNPDVREAMIFYWIEQNRSSDAKLSRKILLGYPD